MHTKETKDKSYRAKPNACGPGSMGQKMLEMMSKCCAGQGGFQDCSASMEGMMEAMKKQGCTSGNDAAESEGSKK